MFNISTDHDVLTITQDDTQGHKDLDVRFDVDGPPMGRQHLFSSASRLNVGGLVDGEYTVQRTFTKSFIKTEKDVHPFTIGVRGAIKGKTAEAIIIDDVDLDELPEVNVDDMTVAEVLEFAAANPESVDYILAAEALGKNRVGITSELS